MVVELPRAGFASGQGDTTRERVLAFLGANAGASIQAVARGTGISHTNAAYHLSVLVRKQAVTRIPMGRLLCHYVGSGTTARSRFLFLVEDRKRLAIIRFMLRPGQVEWTVNQLARSLGYYHGFLYRKLQELSQEGLVTLTPMRSRQYVRATKKLVDLAAQLLPPGDVVVQQTPAALLRSEPLEAQGPLATRGAHDSVGALPAMGQTLKV